jgi:hypothetical protein
MLDSKIGSDYISGLSPNIYNSIIKYTTDYYRTLNNTLEEIKNVVDLEDSLPVGILYDVRNIDAAFASAPPLTKDLIVYRGLHFPITYDSRRHKKILMGNVYKGRYQGYLSTSLYKGSVYEFAKRDYSDCTIMKIHIKKGSRVLFLHDHSVTRDEFEVLLPRNSTLEIYSIKKDVDDDHCTYIKANYLH